MGGGENMPIEYSQYGGEADLPAIIALVEEDLSEPYSIFVYRFFLQRHPELCHLAHDTTDLQQRHLVGVIIGRMHEHVKSGIAVSMRGYIGMLVVRKDYRRRHGIGSELVRRELAVFNEKLVDEVVLEAEVTNAIGLEFYRRFGFIRDKFLPRYYLNGSDAYRLKLFLR